VTFKILKNILFMRFCQWKFAKLSGTNKLSGNVARDLSGSNGYHGYHGGGVHETDRIVTGDPENEI
jgi:hypothetical protein